MTDLVEATTTAPWPSPTAASSCSEFSTPAHAPPAPPTPTPPPPPPAPAHVPADPELADLPRAVPPPPAPEPKPPTAPAMPSSVLAIDPGSGPIVPVGQAAISLPATPALASATPPAAQANTFDFFATPDTDEKTKSGGSVGRILKAVLVLSLLGGAGFGAVVYGPDLYEEHFGEDTTNEPSAPLAFPRSRSTQLAVRTATFELDGASSTSASSYTVTVDFETQVSRVVISRVDAPDVEILTFSDDALIRRLDSDVWYETARGDFPLDDRLERTEWVRLIDELVPPSVRSDVTIDVATSAMVGGVETRHLVITLRPELLDAGMISDITVLDPDTVDPVALDPDTLGTAPLDGSVSPAEIAPLPPSRPRIIEPSVAPTADDNGEITIELWIDAQGIVRRVVGAPQLGADSITVVNVSADPWIPDYPDSDRVEPMTAAALVDLGL